jgi:hypothetical protein
MRRYLWAARGEFQRLRGTAARCGFCSARRERLLSFCRCTLRGPRARSHNSCFPESSAARRQASPRCARRCTCCMETTACFWCRRPCRVPPATCICASLALRAACARRRACRNACVPCMQGPGARRRGGASGTRRPRSAPRAAAAHVRGGVLAAAPRRGVAPRPGHRGRRLTGPRAV